MKTYSKYLLSITALFVTALIVSNIIAGKLWPAPFNTILTAGVFLFPLVYIMGDVIPEVYGLKTARFVIWVGFLCNLVAVGFFMLTLALPYPPFWKDQSAFQVVLGFTPRLVVASFCAYLVGTNANAMVLVWIKRLTNGKYLWMRTIGSTLVGESIDSFIFITLAFFGSVPIGVLFTMILAQAVAKTLFEILATPFTYLVVGWFKEREKIVGG